MSASKKLQAEDALELLKDVRHLYVSKGKKVTYFDVREHEKDLDNLVPHLLGPTGNLRAPTVKTGRTLLVGFHPEPYGSVFE